jgi:hypothetical protein
MSPLGPHVATRSSTLSDIAILRRHGHHIPHLNRCRFGDEVVEGRQISYTHEVSLVILQASPSERLDFRSEMT